MVKATYPFKIFIKKWLTCRLYWMKDLKMFNGSTASDDLKLLKGTVIQIKKVMINDRLRVSKVSWKNRIPIIYNFPLSYRWNLLSSLKVVYFSTVFIVFSVCKQSFTAQYLKGEYTLWNISFRLFHETHLMHISFDFMKFV